MKNFSRIIIKAAVATNIAFVAVFSFSGVVHALSDYTVLSPLPGLQDSNGKTNLETYLPNAFKLAIGIAAIMAFVMITFGGIMYATSDAISGKSAGREYITDAIVGLLLVIGAWVILYTINPEILRFDLKVQDIAIGSATSAPTSVADSSTTVTKGPDGRLLGYKLTDAQVAEDASIRANKLAKTVSVNNPPCATGGTTGCTNVVGLPDNAIAGVNALAADCKCFVQITGGTEGGHKEHGPGLAVMDLSPRSDLNAYLAKTKPEAATPKSSTTVTVGNATYKYENTGENGYATAPHWHVVFN